MKELFHIFACRLLETSGEKFHPEKEEGKSSQKSHNDAEGIHSQHPDSIGSYMKIAFGVGYFDPDLVFPGGLPQFDMGGGDPVLIGHDLRLKDTCPFPFRAGCGGDREINRDPGKGGTLRIYHFNSNGIRHKFPGDPLLIAAGDLQTYRKAQGLCGIFIPYRDQLEIMVPCLFACLDFETYDPGYIRDSFLPVNNNIRGILRNDLYLYPRNGSRFGLSSESTFFLPQEFQTDLLFEIIAGEGTLTCSLQEFGLPYFLFLCGGIISAAVEQRKKGDKKNKREDSVY